MKKQNRKAFTIVELVIVIAVIGILAGVMIPVFGGIIDSANEAADKSTAANLSIALSQEIYGIKDEDDLYRVITETFGADYAASIAPKTADKGNHFYFDIISSTVVLKTEAQIEEMIAEYEAAGANVEQSSVAQLMSTIKSTDSTNGFASEEFMRFRRGSNGKNYFFLLDKTGDIVDNMNGVIDGVVNPGEDNNVGDIIGDLIENGDEATLNQLKNIAIVAKDAIYIYGNPDEVTKIQFNKDVKVIPEQIKVIDEEGNVTPGTYIAQASKLPSFTLPDDITAVNQGGLWFKDDYTVTIKTNWTLDMIKTVFKAGSTNAIIKGTDGEYRIEGEGIVDPETGDKVEDLEYSREIGSFEIKLNSKDAETAKKVLLEKVNGEYTLLVANDYEGQIILEAHSFLDINGIKLNPDVYWNDATKGNVFTFTKNDVTSGIKVAAQTMTKSIVVDVVTVESLTFNKVDETAGKLPETGSNGETILVFDIPYCTKGSSEKIQISWPVDVAPNQSNKKITLDTTIAMNDNDIADNDDDILSFDYATKILNLENKEISGDKSVYVTFTCAGATQIVKFNLIEAQTPAFGIADSAYEGNIPGKSIITVGGGKNAFPAKILFKAIDANVTDNDVVVITLPGGSTIEGKWGEVLINLAYTTDEEDVQIKIVSKTQGSSETSITLPLVKGNTYNVYNTATGNNWNDVNTKIVLLQDITLDSTHNDKSKTVTYFNGNYHKIDATGFYDTTASGNYYSGRLVYISSGTIEKVVINGPIYPEAYTTADISKGKKNGNGVYVTAGIWMAGGTIDNCYVSGFSSPVRLSATATLQNSVLEGGARCNIYANSATIDMNLQDMTLIQKRGGYQSTQFGKTVTLIGAGIFVDTNATCTINITGDFRQYNWVAETDSYSGTPGTIIDKLFENETDCETDEVVYEYDAYIHIIDGVRYANMGIAQEKNDKSVTINYTSNADSYLPTLSNAIAQDKTITSSGFYIWTYEAEGDSCSHELSPTDVNSDGVYNCVDFILDKLSIN